ncbi:MAG TPA: substrate-binding domain-containing protein [Vicinamibacterales bacterium]
MRMQTVVATLVAVLLGTAASHAQEHAVRVLISNGFRAVFDDLVPVCEKSIGHRVAVQSGTSTSLIEKVNAGEPFDVAIMTTEAMETLGKSGKIAARTPLGRSGIGIGSRAGAKKPDIANAEALKKTFLAAKAITYAGDGASRPHIDRMMGTLGIADVMTKKTLLEQGSVRAAARVASGDADLLITLVSEILPAPGVELVGPLPTQFQNYVSFAGAAAVKSDNAAAGKALISCLSGPNVAATLKAKGMEKGS